MSGDMCLLRRTDLAVDNENKIAEMEVLTYVNAQLNCSLSLEELYSSIVRGTVLLRLANSYNEKFPVFEGTYNNTLGNLENIDVFYKWTKSLKTIKARFDPIDCYNGKDLRYVINILHLLCNMNIAKKSTAKEKSIKNKSRISTPFSRRRMGYNKRAVLESLTASLNSRLQLLAAKNRALAKTIELQKAQNKNLKLENQYCEPKARFKTVKKLAKWALNETGFTASMFLLMLFLCIFL